MEKEVVSIRFGMSNVLYGKSNDKGVSFVIAVANNKVIYVPDFKCQFGTISDEKGWEYCLQAEIEKKYFKTYNCNSQKFENLYFDEDDITFENLIELEKEQHDHPNATFKKHSYSKMQDRCYVRIY